MSVLRRPLFALLVVALPLAMPHAQSADREPTPSEAARSTLATALKLSLMDRMWIADQIWSGVGGELLTPHPKWAEQRPKLGEGQSGICRILNRGELEVQLKGVSGNGCYYSFTSRSNDYQKLPQLGLERWRFQTGFYGANTGIVTQIKADSLEAVTIEALPGEMTPERRHVQEEHAEGLRQLHRRFGTPAAAVGGIYAVRAVMWGECDVLAVFEVLEMDEFGVTLGWRVLKLYPTPVQKS